MQAELPITISADSRFSNSLTPLLNKLEMWINFQALKANWYGKEALTLTFHFTLVRTLSEKKEQITAEHWTQDVGVAYHYESSQYSTTAYIAVADLLKKGTAIEQAIKSRLTNVTNAIAMQHDLQPLI